MFNEPIYFTEDVVREYSSRRKALSKEEAADLLRCMIRYIKHLTQKTNTYGIDIPNIGLLYKKFENYKVEVGKDLSDQQYYNMLFDTVAERYSHRLLTDEDSIKRFFGEISLEELQDWQNNGHSK